MGKKSKAPAEGNVEPAEPTLSEETKIIYTRNIKNAFAVFDALGNDTVDIREVGTVLRSLEIFPSEEALRVYILEMEEPEPTGYISYANFFTVAMRILASGGVKRATEQELFQAFLTLDTEKKGYLLPEELRTYLEGDGERFTPEEMMLSTVVEPSDNKVHFEDYVTMLS